MASKQPATSTQRSTSANNRQSTSQAAGAGNTNAELLRLRKELIQAKAANTDLQEELDEKTQQYLDAIKVSRNLPPNKTSFTATRHLQGATEQRVQQHRPRAGHRRAEGTSRHEGQTARV